MEEIDIWRTAKIMVDSHGEDAVIYAALRADAALVEGNSEAEVVWRKVKRVVEELQRTTPRPGERVI